MSKYITVKEVNVKMAGKVRAGKWFAPSQGLTVQLQAVDGKAQISLLNHYTTQEGEAGKAAFFFTSDMQAIKKLAVALATAVEAAEKLPAPQTELSEADALKAELEAVKAELARTRATKTAKSKKVERPAEIPAEVEVLEDDDDFVVVEDLLKALKRR